MTDSQQLVPHEPIETRSPRQSISEVVRRAEMKAIRLRSSQLHLLESDLGNDWTDRVDSFWHVEVVSEQGEDVLMAVATCVIQHWSDPDVGPQSERSTPNYEDNEAPPDVEVFAQYEISYDIREPEALSAEDMEVFCRANSVVHVWPFWREYVHSQTSRMGIPPLTLQTFKVPTDPTVLLGRPSDSSD